MTPEVFDAIIADVLGGEPIRTAIRDHGVSGRQFYGALQRDEAMAERYARASLAGCDALADQALDIADDLEIDSEHKRIMVDTRKWYLSKRMPKKYGDKLGLTGADGEGPVEITATWRDK